MSDEWVVEAGEDGDKVYALYRDGVFVMSWGEGFQKELMNHPEIKAAHDKLKEVTGND